MTPPGSAKFALQEPILLHGARPHLYWNVYLALVATSVWKAHTHLLCAPEVAMQMLPGTASARVVCLPGMQILQEQLIARAARSSLQAAPRSSQQLFQKMIVCALSRHITGRTQAAPVAKKVWTVQVDLVLPCKQKVTMV